MGQCVSDIPQVIQSVVFLYSIHSVEFTGCFIVNGEQKAEKGTYLTENKVMVAIFFLFCNCNYGLNFRRPFDIKLGPAHKKISFRP